jgi:23S rRNA pseudouridine1911/1915/1917 synthase
VNRGFRYKDEISLDGAGESVIEFYTSRYRHSSEQEWRERIVQGAVRLDGEKVTPGTLLRAGHTLSYERAPWTEPEAPSTFGVVYEDGDLLAVDKPSGLPVLPGGHYLDHTLLALVRARFPGEVPPSPLHRLGRATSGLVLFARTEETLRRLSTEFVQRRVAKIYRALVAGVDLPSEQVVDAPIGRVPYPPTGKLHAAAIDGAPSKSFFRLLSEDRERFESLVEVQIVTGRPHQIRIHAAAIGHPLVGDPLYIAGGGPGPLVEGRRPALPGDCGYHLHAMRLAFRHPRTGEGLEVFSPPPPLLRTPDEPPFT